MNSNELALACVKFAENRKAENITVLDVRGVTSVTDFFVICSGSSEPHLKAIINEIREKVFEVYHVHPTSMDGMVGTSWVVLDYYDVIIHVMRSDTRERYDLENFWGDAKRYTVEDVEQIISAEKPASRTAKRKTSTAKNGTRSRTSTVKKTAAKKTTKTAASRTRKPSKATTAKTVKAKSATTVKKRTTRKKAE
ncbi:MAG: ribosome silencing factor [Verrucomicrobia bacterium]|nr:ribosome silencing factor [Verrucomicrobiota bacterium]